MPWTAAPRRRPGKPGSTSCHLIGAAPSRAVGWCPSTGQVITANSRQETRIVATLPADKLGSFALSIASGFL
ncbi:hypothetical protein AB0I81_51850 [Nonomuraea sp. NPDC050404]|uniref:hypothetical protein n=1 Tax=Nonomuraea sp. NPDC050404 TaxID=3155783 RepID=UPI0033C824D5